MKDSVEMNPGDAAVIFRKGKNAIDLVFSDFDIESETEDASAEQVLAAFIAWLLESKTIDLKDYMEEFINVMVAKKTDKANTGCKGRCTCSEGKRKNGTSSSKGIRRRKIA